MSFQRMAGVLSSELSPPAARRRNGLMRELNRSVKQQSFSYAYGLCLLRFIAGCPEPFFLPSTGTPSNCQSNVAECQDKHCFKRLFVPQIDFVLPPRRSQQWRG